MLRAGDAALREVFADRDAEAVAEDGHRVLRMQVHAARDLGHAHLLMRMLRDPRGHRRSLGSDAGCDRRCGGIGRRRTRHAPDERLDLQRPDRPATGVGRDPEGRPSEAWPAAAAARRSRSAPTAATTRCGS